MSVEPIKGVLSAYTNPLYGTLASELLRGYSAYNIAVMEGYEGTVDEWLESLKGEKGDKGDQGDPGPQGEKGDTGLPGLDGETGPKGDKGDKGDTGNGIYAVVLRADYTLSIYFTDGSVYSTPSIRGREGAVGPAGPIGPQGETGQKGDKGDTGDAGVGISSIVQNADHSLTINLDNGTSYTTDPVEALKGDKGDTGNGISSIVMKSDYTLQINMTNGTSYTTPSIRGVAGAKGDKGDTGATGPQGPKGDPGALNFHICSQTEYDATTRVPTVQNPEDDTFYLVPSASVTSPDLFVEWIYVNNTWEMFGSATVDISGKADKVSNATSGNFASLDANGNLTDSGHKHSDYLTEHQDLTDYVKNDDYASSSKGGVVKVPASTLGIYIGSTGIIRVDPASTASIAEGTALYLPIVPNTQHLSTFYGLAKAAGDTTQSASSNAVGMYTDDAKIKIQKMLGIYEAPWELIREDTFTNETEADHVITVDGNGNAFELTDAIIQFETPVQSTEAKLTSSGGIYFAITNGTGSVSIKAELGAFTQAANTSAHGGVMVMLQRGNLFEIYRSAHTTSSNTGALGYRYSAGFPHVFDGTDRIALDVLDIPVYAFRVTIKNVTGTGHYKLYGKRKWS